MYRVEWKVKETGATGHGEWSSDLKMISDAIEFSNKECRGKIIHSLGIKDVLTSRRVVMPSK